MRYNENSPNYDRYIEMINLENNTQSRLLRDIEAKKNKIKELEKEVFTITNDIQKQRQLKLIKWYKDDINNKYVELESSKKRQQYYKQKICNHDFGLIVCEYVDDKGIMYQDGFCLDCNLDIVEKEAPIFVHGIALNKMISCMTFDETKEKLEELKRISDYNTDYDYIIGEKIVDEIIKENILRRKKEV